MWSPPNMDPMMEPLARQETYGRTPEARVLIIMTGGTICMQKSADGLVPVRGFLEACMAPRPEFNDRKDHEAIDVCVADDVTKKMKSLRSPKSTYGKRVRYVPSSR
jgi:lysophospholipase